MVFADAGYMYFYKAHCLYEPPKKAFCCLDNDNDE